ncbi:sugar phosphate nucleotidyltransferase [Acidimicrobiia bacterium]|nr:sugar phosphate nucleotidyltransferase [Acidimicrobiia bacterium]
MKALILAGGKGSRFLEETKVRPKPMIEINNKPLLLHIVDQYIRFGIKDFIILGGHKIEYIYKYFEEQKINDDHEYFYKNKDIKIKVLDTGAETMTGGRIKRAEEFLGSTFLATYGDGISNINIKNLIQFHQKNKRQATVTAVRPPARFGSLSIEDSLVSNFGEKISSHAGWINGGFFVLSKEILKYIDGDETIFEKKPLETLATTSNLAAYKHNGFWYPIDTIREKEIVEDKINNNELSWLYD